MAKFLGAIGLLVAVVVGGVGALATPGVAIPAVLGLGVVGGIAYRAHRRRADRSVAALAAAAVVGSCFVVIGLFVLLGAAALALVLVAALVLGAAVAGLRGMDVLPRGPRLDAPEPPVRPAGPPEPSLPAAVATMSTPALCWAWRRSYLSVHDPPDVGALERSANVRACYLDELERRDPAGFRRWLDHGARAASDPARYIGRADVAAPDVAAPDVAAPDVAAPDNGTAAA